MVAELGRLEQSGEIGRKASLALSNEGVVQPSGGYECHCEDALRWKSAGVVESIMKSDELREDDEIARIY